MQSCLGSGQKGEEQTWATCTPAWPADPSRGVPHSLSAEQVSLWGARCHTALDNSAPGRLDEKYMAWWRDPRKHIWKAAGATPEDNLGHSKHHGATVQQQAKLL